jgi:hypothetical protein
MMVDAEASSRTEITRLPRSGQSVGQLSVDVAVDPSVDQHGPSRSDCPSLTPCGQSRVSASGQSSQVVCLATCSHASLNWIPVRSGLERLVVLGKHVVPAEPKFTKPAADRSHDGIHSLQSRTPKLKIMPVRVTGSFGNDFKGIPTRTASCGQQSAAGLNALSTSVGERFAVSNV